MMLINIRVKREQDFLEIKIIIKLRKFRIYLFASKRMINVSLFAEGMHRIKILFTFYLSY